MRTGPATARQRGFALLIVLWSMALLAQIGTRIAARAGQVLWGSTMLAGGLTEAECLPSQCAVGRA
jgi:hypothetical protein